MVLRRWIGLVALLGVLLHAGLIVRHNAAILNTKLLHHELVTSLGIICHNDGSTARVPTSDMPTIPQPSNNGSDCPICSGLATAAVLLPTLDPPLHVPERASTRIAVTGETIAVRAAGIWPPVRGPPANT